MKVNILELILKMKVVFGIFIVFLMGCNDPVGSINHSLTKNPSNNLLVDRLSDQNERLKENIDLAYLQVDVFEVVSIKTNKDKLEPSLKEKFFLIQESSHKIQQICYEITSSKDYNKEYCKSELKKYELLCSSILENIHRYEGNVDFDSKLLDAFVELNTLNDNIGEGSLVNFEMEKQFAYFKLLEIELSVVQSLLNHMTETILSTSGHG